MILAMVKRKKKTGPQKAKPKDSEVKFVEKETQVVREDDEELPAFGILPNRDLKKSLGCG
jgi:hypothetical protein